MSKGKRSSSRRPVSKERIAQARFAKSHGLISKRAKLQNGRLSRAVEKKVARLEELRAVPTYEFRPGAKSATQARKAESVPIKLKSDMRAEAKAKGYDIFQGQIIAPKKSKKEFETAISKGHLAGTQTELEIDGIFTIDLTAHGITNYKQLRAALSDGTLDAIKGDALYSFTFHDHTARQQQFLNGRQLLKYLEKYQWDEEGEFEALQIYVTAWGVELENTPQWVLYRDRHRLTKYRDARSRKAAKMRALRAKQREKVNAMHDTPKSAEKLREYEKLKKRRQRAELRQVLGDDAFKAREASKRLDRLRRARKSK